MVSERAQGNSPTPSTHTSFAIGRYQLIRFFSEGGKKKAYLTHETTLDRICSQFLLATPVGTSSCNRVPVRYGTPCDMPL